jgi:hypothetical protein
MIVRLGRVLYWAGIAGPAFVSVVFTFPILSEINRHPLADSVGLIAIFNAIAALIWVAGRACRYVLAGE